MTTPDDVQHQFRQQLKALDVGPRILIAFSGGLDSSVLVDLFDGQRDRGGPEIELVHIDHGLRPNSGDDARFCEEIARRRGLSLEVITLDFDAERVGQHRARQRRLAAIAGHARSRGIDEIATAHHGDDRIESFVLNLRRGTGLDGLAPMPAEASFPIPGVELRLLRPLVGLLRHRLESYATDRGIQWIEDPTNDTDAYARNRIRHHRVPALADSSSDRRQILETIERLEDERRAADSQCAALADEARRPAPGIRIRAFDRRRLQRAPRATVIRLFRDLQPSLDAASLDAIYGAIDAEPSSTPTHLTLSGCVITVVRNRVTICPSEERGGRDVLQQSVHPIDIAPFSAGRAPYFGSQLVWSTALSAEVSDGDPCFDTRWSAEFVAGKLNRPLYVAGFTAGCRLRRRNDNGRPFHQKLTKLFSEYRIDADIRWRWPCLYDAENRLVWAAGLPRGAEANRSGTGEKLWSLQVRPGDELTEMIQS